MSAVWSLSEGKRTWREQPNSVAFDPSRKWGCIAAVGTMSMFAAEGRAIDAADHSNGTCFARLVQRFTALQIVE